MSKSAFWSGSVAAMLLLAAQLSPAPATAQEPVCEPAKLAEKYPDLVGKKIRIGADPQTRPFVYRDPDKFDNIIGFDADLARAVFDCAGIEYEFFLGGWSGLVPAVMAGQIDIMWDALYYLPERAQKVNFVIYMQAGVGAVVRPGNPKNVTKLEDLCGLKASTLLGTVEEATLKEQDEKCRAAGQPGIDINVGPDTAAALRLLLNDRVDVFFIDLGLAHGVAKERADEVTFAFKHLTGLTQAAAVPKDREQLLQAVYDGLRVMQANGTQKALYDKYGMDAELQLPAKIMRE